MYIATVSVNNENLGRINVNPLISFFSIQCFSTDMSRGGLPLQSRLPPAMPSALHYTRHLINRKVVSTIPTPRNTPPSFASPRLNSMQAKTIQKIASAIIKINLIGLIGFCQVRVVKDL